MKYIIADSVGTIPQLNKKQRLGKFSKTLSFKLIIVGLLIGGWAFVYKFWLLDIVAPFAFFVPLGDLCYGVALSIIASIIFYFVTVFIPKYQSRKKINSVIERNLYQLYKLSDLIMHDISGILEFDETKKGDWMASCEGDLKSEGPKWSIFNPFGEKISWADYFDAIIVNEDHYIARLRDYRQFLPEEVLLLIDDIENTDKFRSAFHQYVGMYGEIIHTADGEDLDVYRNINGFNNVLWNHMKNMHQILTAYQLSRVD